MSEIKFVIFILVYLFIGYYMTFELGPKFIENAKEINTAPSQLSSLEQIKIAHHPEGKDVGDSFMWKNYLFIDFYAPRQDRIRLDFSRSDENHLSFLDVLLKNGIIDSYDSFYDQIPITYSKEDLKFIKK
ncbi:hypothetical protein HX109_08615 [Galbibacter sp. BG1]|uniref:hypothetical protein n=1 Tax=Galbibacter sp. BG1 TaxID=1170699 RepID=UPI0015BF5D76|nr:hypothetical protein [Galbibacter sp. BG1]QLE01626.1 hypothetical protein HX109_08615 [Galbibacter sp. BG1]